MTTKTKGDNLGDNGPAALNLSAAERDAALKAGAKEDAKEIGKNAHRALTDGNLPGEAPDNRWAGSDEIMQWSHLIDLGVEQFEDAVAKTGVGAIPDEKVYGLLALERNGQNRTPYVKACMKRLGLKADELPGGGPDYTNDVTNISKL